MWAAGWPRSPRSPRRTTTSWARARAPARPGGPSRRPGWPFGGGLDERRRPGSTVRALRGGNARERAQLLLRNPPPPDAAAVGDVRDLLVRAARGRHRRRPRQDAGQTGWAARRRGRPPPAPAAARRRRGGV